MDQDRNTTGLPGLPTYRPNGRSLGILFEDVDVWGNAAGESRAQDMLAVFENILYNWPKALLSKAIGRSNTNHRRLLQDAVGVVPPGETLLVLGRPGAGCSTLLKVLANQRLPFVGVDGNIQYGPFSASEMGTHYRSEVIYNAEDDVHFPTLSVANTMAFALKLRKPERLNDETDNQFASRMTDAILRALKIEHTKDTIVGDAYVRGVSGGERKRVSLAEVLSAAPAVVCWDNPLRGLDSSSALMFLRLLRAMSTTTGMTNIVTAYQISETIYQECFDRVLVLYEGHVVYSGAAGNTAKEYFTDHLGFFCPQRQTTPDFLTAVTSPDEQWIDETLATPPPLTPEGMSEAFRRSPAYQSLQAEIRQYRDSLLNSDARAAQFEQEVGLTKTRMTTESATTVRAIHTQLLVAMKRYYQLVWGGRSTLFTILALNTINGLVIGAAYFQSPNTYMGAFQRSGAIFFALIYFALNGLAEASSMIHARPILQKHHSLGLLNPGLSAVAVTIADLPICFVQTIFFTLPYYFLVGLQMKADGYWFFELVIFAAYASFLALFRALGATAPNVPIALLLGGIALPIILLHSGYAPPWPTLLGWDAWIRRISPSPYALEALMGYDFKDATLQCEASELVPSGPAYENISIANQGCSIPGNTPGSATVPGSRYLQVQFDYLPSHAWRNFGIIIVFWVIFVIWQCLTQAYMTEHASDGVFGRVYKRSAVIPVETKAKQDEEKQFDIEAQTRVPSPESQSTQVDSSTQNMDIGNKAAFVFSEVTYKVTTADGPRTLLSSVSGYVKPGQLTALMGASGAGKTTLLDTLAQRKTDGSVSGDIRIGGQSVIDLGKAFSQACGFCMQQDVHEPGTTVREALMFSSMMRRPLSISKAEKQQHVENVMDLLALQPIADAMIGVPGEGGLGVEERKRLTIGVELAADPSALLFLDEPTSGLDSQAAYSLVRFLQDIAASGVPIICTIHQPSAIIFDMFDHIMLLAPGGQTIYFGETGDQSSTVVEYFARNGVEMDSTANPAEFILETVAERSVADEWASRWRTSPENQAVVQQIETINQGSPKTDLESHSLPFLSQVTLLIQRHAISVWRDGFYGFSRLVKTAFMAMFVGFAFFMPGDTQQNAQNRILIMLLLQWIVPASCGDLQSMWYAKWALFTTRERSGVGYHPLALCTALVAVEIPLAIVIYTIGFLCGWLPVGLGYAGFGYLNLLALSMFGIGYPFAIASLSINEEVAGYTNSLIWCVMATFGGIAIPHSKMNDFYRPWLFWADPLRYWLGTTAAAALHEVPVRCADQELTMIEPPVGSTCGEYMGNYLSTKPGYIENPNATEACAFCAYSTGDEYIAQFSFFFSERWRDWGIFTGFCISTLCLVFLVSWLRYGRVWKR